MQYLVDAIIVSEASPKTLSQLYGLIVDAPDPTNAADCLRISPWTAETLNGPKRTMLLEDLLSYAQVEGIKTVFVSKVLCFTFYGVIAIIHFGHTHLNYNEVEQPDA